MSELEQAFQSEDYRKVLELTNGKTDIPSITHRISAYIGLKRYQEALDLLIKHREELYKLAPKNILEVNFTLRFELGQFDEAFDDIGIFGDYPYISQEVEEELRALPKRVRKAEKEALKREQKGVINLSLEQPEESLLKNLDAIEIDEVPTYRKDLRKVVSSLGKDGARTYALMLLVAAGDKEEIKFLKNGSEFVVVPADLERPFSGNDHLRFLDMVAEESKDPSLTNIALTLYSKALVAAYPEPLLAEGKLRDYALAFIDIAKEYLHLDNNTPSVIDPDVIVRVHKFLDAAA